MGRILKTRAVETKRSPHAKRAQTESFLVQLSKQTRVLVSNGFSASTLSSINAS